MDSHQAGVAVAPRTEKRSVVLLKSRQAFDAEQVSSLESCAEVIATAPDTLYLKSTERSAAEILAAVSMAMGDRLHIAVDYSSAMKVVSVSGAGSRDVLSAGTSIDTSPEQFGAGDARRTCLAGISVILSCTGDSAFEIYCDRSHAAYLLSWLETAAETEQLIANMAG